MSRRISHIKLLGGGGTGDTHLFKDETTDMLFAIKKYVPRDTQFIDDHYVRFVDEIKILFNISHPNIVRIYNYYLYPDAKTGFLQMEYIDGVTIDQYSPEFPWDKDWNEIFTEVITAFAYLEKNHILHRDIRPANIMIDKQNIVKVVDFGFGKQLDTHQPPETSILLNWPATDMPDEVQLNQQYDERTEIYFVGTLFRHLLKQDDDFRFHHILEKMTKVNPNMRYSSFSEITTDISAGVLSEIDFTQSQKQCYRAFADTLMTHIDHYNSKFSPTNNPSLILSELAALVRNSSLEMYLQDNRQLINCFLRNAYTYKRIKDIEVQLIINFYSLVTSLPSGKQKILFDNIYNRLSTVPVILPDDELPF